MRLRRVVLTCVFGALAVTAGALLAWAVVQTWHFLSDAPGDFWAIAFLALVADLTVFGGDPRTSALTRTPLSACFAFAIFAMWGPAPAIVVQTCAASVSAWRQALTPLRGMFLVSRLIVAFAAAELTAYLILGDRPITQPGVGLDGRDMMAFIPPMVTWLVVSFGLGVLIRGIWRSSLRAAMFGIQNDILSTAVALLVVSPLLTTISGWWTAMIVIPVLVLNQVLRDEVSSQERLRREPVTGLLNRSGLLYRLGALTAGDTTGSAGPRSIAIVFVNAYAALTVSHNLGRGVYEDMIAAAGERLKTVFGDNQVGRLGGEGFVIMLPDLTTGQALEQADLAVRVLEPAIYVEGIPFGVDPTAGVAIFPQHGRDLTTLIGNAELAVADAHRGARRAALYARNASDTAQYRLDILADLSAELTGKSIRNGLSVLYQPQVDLATGRPVGVEALVRWTHPVWGPVPTGDLISAIESSQIMQLLTRRVVREATTQLAAWNEAGTPMRVSVNVSMNDLRTDVLPDILRAALATTKIQPEQLTVEITEGAVITDLPRIGLTARAITALGIGLSLDDFGTGYASLQQLRRLPLTEVKIDRAYVADIVTNPASQAIIRSLHELSQALGLTVVAEGIEDEATAAALSRLPGMIGQGWLFGRPMPPAELEHWLRERGGCEILPLA
ncbi:putative bifunctional diguanylate cyclase/phosphodiesterase [Hamadaea tsunoensis]|uniref:putative bifunctional diguanylate cyclase/phosphodiesterase n=1 Tax=Hamadaea tsunoensis TaxID=53368 RepID=UPI00146FA0B6|nr:GGDEF domain-containing phosphodiesterase [Hamadaea tsunoensis]